LLVPQNLPGHQAQASMLRPGWIVAGQILACRPAAGQLGPDHHGSPAGTETGLRPGLSATEPAWLGSSSRGVAQPETELAKAQPRTRPETDMPGVAQARRPGRSQPGHGPGERKAEAWPRKPCAGRERPKPAHSLLMSAERGQNSPMPAHEHEYRPGKIIFRPGELYAGPGNAEVDPEPTYAGRDINMPVGT
jgi:hypothetical protein